AEEQVMLEDINDARADPPAYGRSIGLDLSGVAPSQPLTFDPLLIEAARLHSQDMNDRRYFAHVTPDGVDSSARIRNAGFNAGPTGESLAAGYRNSEDALAGLIIDEGLPDVGHRRHLLAIDDIFKPQ